MGLLDNIFNTEQGRMGLGLLAAGSARSDGAGFGQRLSEAVGSVDQWKQQQAQAKRMKMQEEYQAFQMQQAMAQAEQQKKMQGLAGQFRTPAVGMAADGFGPSTPAGFDREGYASALEALDPMAGLQYAANIQKQSPKLTAYKPGDSVRDESGREVFSVPQDPKDAPKTDLAKLLAERNALPEGDPSRALYDKQILKITTHQSPVSVSYGAPVAGVDTNNKPVFFSPSKDGGAPRIIPGVAPAGGGAKLTEDQAKAQGWLAQAEAAYANMMKAKKDEPGAESPGAADVMQKIPLIGNAAANSARSSARQRYIQGAGAFGEAALRAATGAGMNVYEAEQKIAQFTPSFMDSQETIKQKERDMQVFLKTLRPRATGKVDGAAPADDSDPLNIRGGR